ncbi:MAG TPA: glutamine synthetase beta-grasp domain-containing protein, partial [Ktedonobacterales bacterium]|nr:glutamine synthetase beta-grasp domain-containing protein [Ktedonobacterales bacterium]
MTEHASSYGPAGVGQPEEERRLLAHVETHGIDFINLEFTDVIGMAKCVTIPADQLPETLARGKWVDGSAIEGFARVAETDMFLRPDLSTYAEIPQRMSNTSGDGEAGTSGVARLICDVLMPTGERFAGDPRAMLLAALEDAAALGYRYHISPELEFFLLREREGTAREPLPHDRGGYFDLSTDEAADVRREIVSELGRMDIRIEA